MATPIPVRGYGSDKHMTSEYVIVPIHLIGTEVEAVVTREAHLVDGLRAKMLVGMDVMGPDQIDIITSKKQAVIGACQRRHTDRSTPTKPSYQTNYSRQIKPRYTSAY